MEYYQFPSMQVKQDVFLHCEKCKKVLFAKDFNRNLRVCTACGHHHRMSAEERILTTVDAGSFVEMDSEMQSADPLGFPDYAEKLERGRKTTGRYDSIVRGRATLNSNPISLAIADFRFMGGSMGSVAGEKITRTLEFAEQNHMPAIVFTATGGARMQEGLLSLMQMAKTSAACEKLSRSGWPFVCVFTDPTMAGVLASYASLADIILAEPGALVGFAGARVSAQAGVAKVPDNFQTSEYNFEHGMIDKIVHRRDMKETLSTLVGHFRGKR